MKSEFAKLFPVHFFSSSDQQQHHWQQIALDTLVERNNWSCLVSRLFRSKNLLILIAPFWFVFKIEYQDEWMFRSSSPRFIFSWNENPIMTANLMLPHGFQFGCKCIAFYVFSQCFWVGIELKPQFSNSKQTQTTFIFLAHPLCIFLFIPSIIAKFVEMPFELVWLISIRMCLCVCVCRYWSNEFNRLWYDAFRSNTRYSSEAAMKLDYILVDVRMRNFHNVVDSYNRASSHQ